MKFLPRVFSLLILLAPLLLQAQPIGYYKGIGTPADLERGEQPDRWTIEADKDSPPERWFTGKLPNRLYSFREPELHAPLTIKTHFPDVGGMVVGVEVAKASRGGAVLDAYLNGQLKGRVRWPSADATHEVGTIYYLKVPHGRHEVQFRVSNAGGVVVLSQYYIAGVPPGDNAVNLAEVESKSLAGTRAEGYEGIWFTLGQRSEYGDKYSGGLGTYTAKHFPLAVHAPEVDKTFFVYGGTLPGQRHLLAMVGSYNHADRTVERPVVVHDKMGVNDPHDNPSLSLDDEGHLWLFISGRGRHRPGFKYRSVEPYSIDAFALVSEEEMAYPQPWHVRGAFLHMFTKYTRGRELYYETSEDGFEWSGDKKLAGFGGHYETSRAREDGLVGAAFNYHPGGVVDKRTNLYYLQTDDLGETWTTAAGESLELPLDQKQNPALIYDYEAQAKNVYLKDLNYSAEGHPAILYITSGGHEPGPANEPREWRLARWTGGGWRDQAITRSDHNYDMGSLYIGGDTWRIIAPAGIGPQPWQTGGEVELWLSEDAGDTWRLERKVTEGSRMNHTYVRRPLDAADPFYAFWADGDPTRFSPSRLYFTNSTGDKVWRLPAKMEDDHGKPKLMEPAEGN